MHWLARAVPANTLRLQSAASDYRFTDPIQDSSCHRTGPKVDWEDRQSLWLALILLLCSVTGNHILYSTEHDMSSASVPYSRRPRILHGLALLPLLSAMRSQPQCKHSESHRKTLRQSPVQAYDIQGKQRLLSERDRRNANKSEAHGRGFVLPSKSNLRRGLVRRSRCCNPPITRSVIAQATMPWRRWTCQRETGRVHQAPGGVGLKRHVCVCMYVCMYISAGQRRRLFSEQGRQNSLFAFRRSTSVLLQPHTRRRNSSEGHNECR